MQTTTKWAKISTHSSVRGMTLELTWATMAESAAESGRTHTTQPTASPSTDTTAILRASRVVIKASKRSFQSLGLQLLESGASYAGGFGSTEYSVKAGPQDWQGGRWEGGRPSFGRQKEREIER
jgi:hypothetical protein